MNTAYDVIIVGAGPAGLSAALVLGGARRRVLLLDGGPPRNAAAEAAHGLFTREGAAPAALKQLGLRDLQPYNITVLDSPAREVRSAGKAFELRTEQRWLRARRLLLATGVRDVLPRVPGLRERWGHTVHHCPYCDGWPHRKARLGVLGSHQEGHHLALSVRAWSNHLALLTNGPDELTPAQRSDLQKEGMPVITSEIQRLSGTDCLTVHFTDRPPLELDALFLNPTQLQNSTLPVQLGCELNDKSRVVVNEHGMSCVPGIWAAGDMTGAPQYVISAAASGHNAAVSLNSTLIHEDVRGRGAAFHNSPDEAKHLGEA